MAVHENRKGEINEQFGRAAELYATSEHRGGRDLDGMIELAAPTGDEDLLDIATGAGHTALAFAPLVRHVVVTDLADKMLDKARSLFQEAGLDNAEFKIADAQELPFPDGSFDIVTCRIAPHHFLDIHACTAEAVRVLKPGGAYVLVDSMAPDDATSAQFLDEVERLRDPTHVRSYSRGEWHAICARAGLVVAQDRVERKRRAFDFWLERGGAERVTASKLRELFTRAPEDVRRAFEIEIDDGEVRAFTDDKLVLLARTPA